MRKIDTKEYTLLYDAVMHIKLISDFDTINKKLNFMTEISSEDFLPLNQKLRIYQKSLNALTDNSMDQKIAASGVYSSIEELIKDMQFHDVIHQRLDHVRKINTQIQKELNEISYDPMYLNKTQYIKIISQLAKINFVQIQAINYEYRLVIENLKKSLATINQTLNVESNPYHDVYCFSNVSLFSVLTETICNKLKNISEMVYPEKNYNTTTSAEELKHISSLYTMEGERTIFIQVLELSEKNLSVDVISNTILKEFTKSASDNRFELF